MSGLTANYNNYSAIELEKALQSWVEPYPKPIILNHDLNSEPIGRVMAARMDKEEDGSSFVRLQIAVTDPVAAQKIADKRYMTGSVGGRAGKAVCSISGDDLASEDASGKPNVARFKRGKVYKGKMAFVDMQDISFKEYSFVNQPADQRSGVRGSKPVEGKAPVADSENWVARSSAFILHMDNEDIVSINENESMFKNMKKKESRPVYLHLKGAFLSAMAVQESENVINEQASLLSNEDSIEKKYEENLKMDDVAVNEDILAVAQELSEDLSTLASASKEEESAEEVADETNESAKAEVEEVKPLEEEVAVESDDELAKAKARIVELEAQIVSAAPAAEEESTEVAVATEEQDKVVVDSVKAEISEENKETEGTEAELTGETVAPEQNADDSVNKLQALEEENQKLRSALHRTLAERVVDAKITVGIESYDAREALVADHVKRTASSLADSLRDLAGMPAAKKAKAAMPEINFEIEATENETGVITLDGKDQEKETVEATPFEDIFVDALMGRRKL
jgi:hypothetical protein